MRHSAFIAAGAWLSGAYVRGDDADANLRRASVGKLDSGQPIDVFTLTNSKGGEVRVMNYGATLMTVKTPDRQGKADSVCLYLDTLEDYAKGPLLGSVVGRFANRIANARYTIDGVEYKLTANAKPHHIHGGGDTGFQKAVWSAEPVRQGNRVGVRLAHVSPDGEAGYPGTVRATVEYWLSLEANVLSIAYSATTDKPTHVNLTNHAYWNLAGAGSGDMLKHVLTLHASRYLDADKARIPNGKMLPVAGTPMDFTRPMPIGSRIDEVDGKNYDHCYVVDGSAAKDVDPAHPTLVPTAKLFDPASGRTMDVATSQPGVQLYTGRGMSNRVRAGGHSYGPYHGVCLETQHFPDSPNRPEFPTTLVRPGQTLRETTQFTFKSDA